MLALMAYDHSSTVHLWIYLLYGTRPSVSFFLLLHVQHIGSFATINNKCPVTCLQMKRMYTFSWVRRYKSSASDRLYSIPCMKSPGEGRGIMRQGRGIITHLPARRYGNTSSRIRTLNRRPRLSTLSTPVLEGRKRTTEDVIKPCSDHP